MEVGDAPCIPQPSSCILCSVTDTLPLPRSSYDRLCAKVREVGLLASAQSLLTWDERTKLPPAGGEYRAEQVSYLAGLIHRRQTDPEVGEPARRALGKPAGRRSAQRRRRRHPQSQARLRPEDKTPAGTRRRTGPHRGARAAGVGRCAEGERLSRGSSRFWRRRLSSSVKKPRRSASTACHTMHSWTNSSAVRKPSKCAACWPSLREQLVPLVAAIVESGRRPNMDILRRRFPIDAQERFGLHVAEAIGFDFTAGRLDVTDHPFCSTSGPRDVRLTTHYYEYFFPSALYSILHEAGHGIYEQGLRADQFGLPTGEAVSLGVHESQSRMWENLVGRSRPFWEHFYGEAQRSFPEALGNVLLNELYFAINDVRPSLIRIEADEATYNLHVMVRFELEQAVLHDELRVADLPGAWNEKYREYLGVQSPTDADGVLQDVHWSAGLVGYFPTYTLGNLYASQLFETAEAELGDFAAMFRRGEFRTLRDWLRTRVHEQGRRYVPAELVRRITGEGISHGPLMRHLRGKFGSLYGLSQ